MEDLKNVTGAVYKTESFGAVDGPGIRYVFFLQGCPLRCLYCHNPESIPRIKGVKWTAGQIVDEVLRYTSFIKRGGVTFSGGEPLYQPEFVYAAATLLKEAGIGAALDTSGGIYPGDPAVRMAIGAAELLLMDIKAWDNETAVKLTGRGVENALATLDYCETTGKPVWIRYVLLTGYTDDDRQLNATADYLTRYKCVKRVELLPFHKLGEAKWEQSGRKYLLGKTPATTKEQTENAKAIIASYGLPVQ